MTSEINRSGNSMADKIPLKLPKHFIFQGGSIIETTVKCHETADIEIKDGKVVKIASEIEAPEIARFDASQYMIAPGFINSHTHSAMGFFRDLGHGKEEMIENFLFPAEKALTDELIKPLSYSYIAGSLKSGTTFISDHYYMVEGTGLAAEKIGIKAAIGETIADLGGAFPEKATFEHARKSIESWSFSNNIYPVLAPHASDTVSDSQAQKISEYSKKNNIPIHMHLSQTKGELSRTKSRTGKTPTQWANDVGLLGPNTTAVHLVSVNENDIGLLEKAKSTGIICPASQIIYETLAPISRLKNSKVPLAIATDCAASNDGADLLSEVKFAALLDKYCGSDAIDHQYWLDSITLTPARALGLESSVGSLEAGKSADFILLKKAVETLPLNNIIENLIFSQHQGNIEYVAVNGEFSLYEGKLAKVSESSLKEEYISAVAEISKRCSIKA